MTARRLAYELLIKAEKGNQFSNIALDNALRSSNLKNDDKRLASALFYGVIEKRITLDHRIASLSSIPLNKLDLNVLTSLRLGIYQLMFLERIPPHAAINETVSLVPKKASGFVNAVLRQHLRKKEFSLPDKSDLSSYLSVKYSVSLPLAKKFISVFGENAEQILKGFEETPKTTLRTNTLKISRDELAAKISDSEPHKNCSCAIFAKGAVRDIYGFEEGLFFVQDIASQICVEALGAMPGQTVLDICACPGSKSFGIAINMNNQGSVISFDLHKSKLSLIESGAARLGIDIIEARERDGRDFTPEFFECADRILCDVPCSGFGVLAKKPELRYKDPKESERLPEIQQDILSNACKYLKKDGILLYSTCTLLPEENEENIKQFLNTHKDFELCPWNECGIDCKSGMITLYPHINGTDGFFIAKLKRKKI